MKEVASVKKYLKHAKLAFLFALLFSFFINVFALAMPIYSMQVLDRVLSSNSVETLIFLSLVILLFFTFYSVLSAVRTAIFLNISEWLDKKISPDLFDFSIDKNDGASSNTQNLRDLQTIRSFIASPSFALLFDAPFALIFLSYIFVIHPLNGLVTVIGALLLLKMAFLNEKLTKDLIEKNNELQININRDFEIISSNSESLKAMAMRSNVKKIWQKANDELRHSNNQLSNRINTISSITKFLRLTIQMLTMAVSAILVIYNKMSVGGIIAVSTLSGKVLAPFDSAVSLWKSIVGARKSYGRLNEFLKKIDEKITKIDLPTIRGELFADKLFYKIKQNDQLIIKGLSFHIKPGEVIAVVGPGASGKTTLARLIVGAIEPSSGIIRLDDADLCDQDFEKIGKYIGYLPQDIELFKGTIKENIARMNANAKDEDIIKVAQLCNIHKMILSFEKGYETEIDKNSLNLSAGQRQRLGLARACFGDVKLVVLDEPNSNLDTEGEEALIRMIQDLRARRVTVILITHKPSIAAFCDKIMVLKNGHISAFDTTKNILTQTTSSNA
jgi:PrtD family type I secretion system ABC transporter